MKTALAITLWLWLCIIVALQICIPMIDRAQERYAPMFEEME